MKKSKPQAPVSTGLRVRSKLVTGSCIECLTNCSNGKALNLCLGGECLSVCNS